MTAVVILAAGKGTRMNSNLPKVLHLLNDRTLIEHVVTTAERIHPDRIIAVVGHQREQVMQTLEKYGVRFAVQEPPMGTGHAVKCAKDALLDFSGDIIVLSGDVPLLREMTLRKLIQHHQTRNAAATVLTTIAPNPFGYGRIVRDNQNGFLKIVEERDATDSERKIQEINSGIYCFNAAQLWRALDQVQPNNAKGEYYLTDVLGILVREGMRVEAIPAASFDEVRGINTPEELAGVEEIFSREISVGLRS